jgi:multidrug efflux system outer membrane protein
MSQRPARVAALAFAALALVVAGCAVAAGCAPVGPNYVRPAMQPPPQYRFGPGTTEAESIADLPWWQVFDDPALQALIREAIANNLDVRAAVARVERARAQAGIARSFLYPQVDGEATYTARQNLGEDDDAPQNGGDNDDVRQNGVYGFRLSWELDLFGRIRRERESAIAVMLATEQARRGVLVTLVGDVASNYFRLRELDTELAIARQTLRVNDETVTYFQNRLDGGVSSRLELDRMTANRATTAATIPDLEQQTAVVEDALSLLVGRPPGDVARGETPSELPPAIPVGMPASLLARRPDVLEAEQRLVAANADIGAARALFFPTISLTGVVGGISGDLASLLGGHGAVWELSPGLLQPVFNGGRLRRNLEAAQASFAEGLALYQKAALNGYREVADALIGIQKLADARVQHELGAAALVEAADLSRSRYDAGLANYIEILTADEQLFEQQQLVAQTIGAEMRARAELYRALGGGWQQPQQP